MYKPLLVCADSTNWLKNIGADIPEFDVTFLDPPFNQGKEYRVHDDHMSETDYWNWMTEICTLIYNQSSSGAAIYFMQREKNCSMVLETLRKAGWQYQNLIVWKKLTSAIPGVYRFGKAFQIIAFATKGIRPKIFNRLRVDPPLPAGYSPRKNGIFLTDIWDDIRELTSGYFAGSEPLREDSGERFHKQQSPVALLLRIILSSTVPGQYVFDPFAGTGTTVCVAQQLNRNSIGIEIDPQNYKRTLERIREFRPIDNVLRLRSSYKHTIGLSEIWPFEEQSSDIHESMQSRARINK